MTHKKVKHRKVLDGELDCVYDHSFWRHTSDRGEFEIAERYLSLVMPLPDAKAYRRALWNNRTLIEHHDPLDILRASNSLLASMDDPEVYRYLRVIQDKDELSPVLIIRGNYQRPAQIAYGYYKVCASYHTDPAVMIPTITI